MESPYIATPFGHLIKKLNINVTKFKGSDGEGMYTNINPLTNNGNLNYTSEIVFSNTDTKNLVIVKREKGKRSKDAASNLNVSNLVIS